MHRRTFIADVAMSAAILSVWHPAVAATQARRPQVTGPITGGKHGRPLAAYPKDLSRLGYIEEEYFVSGEAANYSLSSEQTRDGKWSVTPTGQTKPYTTRILVHRPKDPSRFNGTVLAEWINVTPGNDNVLIPDDPIYAGFVYVGVSAQAVGVHGFPDARPETNYGLTAWDPERYKALSHPGDSFSFDIYHQIGRLLKSRGGGVDPLRGLRVRKVIATGASQSAARLRTYLNAIHPLDPVYDACIPFLDFGNGTAFTDNVQRGTVATGTSPSFRIPTRIREDLDLPVIVVLTEQESVFYRGDRAAIMQPDTERFRQWEVAGAPHSPAMPTIRGAIGQRDGFRREIGDSGPTVVVPTIPGGHVTSWHCTIAALYHVHEWINGGPAPPHAPRLRFTEGTTLVRDSLDIGTGGIRLPEVDVPTEMNTGRPDDPQQRSNRGVSAPIAPYLLARLYASHEEYVNQVTAAALAAQSAGFIRPYRVQEYIDAAKAAQIPPTSGAS